MLLRPARAPRRRNLGDGAAGMARGGVTANLQVMSFKPIGPTGRAPKDPEELFRDLRTRHVEGLLSHQADVLRDYVGQGIDAPDVALQLPTGSGKTLVGLLIAEWRRVSRGERALFLCPTNQLVHQVAAQAKQKFGLRPAVFTGPKASYAPGDAGDFHAAEAVAITSYSALFNSNPFFKNAQVIVLDDAHTSENYIASPWTLTINRHEYEALYVSLTELLSPFVPPSLRARFRGVWTDSFEKNWSDLIPPSRWDEVRDDLVALLDKGVQDEPRLMFAWHSVRDHLHACQLLIGTGTILIRPWIPPTGTHAPFGEATQRIYMSATLGGCGDLERITGRTPILRLAPPATYEKHGVGRRLFLFPQRSLERSEVRHCVEDSIRIAGRALYLVPDEGTAADRRLQLNEALGAPVFDARDIETSKGQFVSSPQAVAVVANRYDGIDLAGDECRLLVLERLPRARSLLERFVIERMGASALLTERLCNRIVQAVGRCTRADTDYAVVLALGEELTSGLLQADRRRLFHPELQAELEFGIEQSKDSDRSTLLSYVRLFLEQGEEWHSANQSILQLRDASAREVIPGARELATAVEHEVAHQYALWYGDWEGALDHAREVVGTLTHPHLRGYRALWNYWAGVAAWRASQAGVTGLEGAASTYFRAAYSGCRAVSWLQELARPDQAEESDVDPLDDGADALVVRMEAVLEDLGTQHNRKFSAAELEIRTLLRSSNSRKFEAGHVALGRLLGYDAGNREDTGAPDPWWIVDDRLCFVFEDHSNANATSRLSVKKARQAASHVSWARAELPLAEGATVVPILVSPISSVDPAARPHLVEVLHWRLDAMLGFADAAVTVVRELRKSFPGPGDAVWRAEACAMLREKRMAPRQLMESLSESTAVTLGL